MSGFDSFNNAGVKKIPSDTSIVGGNIGLDQLVSQFANAVPTEQSSPAVEELTPTAEPAVAPTIDETLTSTNDGVEQDADIGAIAVTDDGQETVEDTVAENAEVPEYAAQSDDDEDRADEDEYNFTFVEVSDEDLTRFLHGHNPSLTTVDCVADLQMLLPYMASIENKHSLTLSFEECGVDPIVFDRACDARNAESGEEDNRVLSITDHDGNVGIYEKLEVDGKLYLSCLSRCLDVDYMRSIITEATEAIYTHNEYVYTLVGPRVLSDGEFAGKMVETLKLNSYETSALATFMSSIPGVKRRYAVRNNHAVIVFTRNV